MGNNSEKEVVVGGLFWKMAERLSSQGVSFIISVVLARLLMPEEYGVIAMITVYITFANVFVTGGIASALIQKKDADDLDFNSLMYCSVACSIVVYVMTYFAAPLIADFFHEPLLIDVTRVYAVTLIFNGYNCVQQAWVSKNMKFKKFFYSSLSAVVLSGTIGVVMAYNGFGVWALVWQNIIYSMTVVVVIKSMIAWNPKLEFSWQRAKGLLSYGWKLLAANFFSVVYYQLRQLLIGRFYTATDLALYNRGKHYPELVTNNIDSSFSQVLFPAMSKYGDDSVKIKQMTRRAMQTSSYIMFFLMFTMLVVAYPMIRLMLTDKWVECVPYLQMMCVARALHSITTANLQAISAIGRSDLVLKLEFIKKPMGLLMIAVSIQFGVFWVALTLPVYSVYSACVNMYPNQKTIKYKYKEQFRDLMPAVLLSVLMLILVYPLNYVGMNDWLLFALQLFLCCFIYFGGSILFKVESFFYCKTLLVGMVKGRAA